MASTTNPTYWFLPKPPYTDGNLVNPLIDRADFYKNLKDTVSANSGFSNIQISGWKLRKDAIIDNRGSLTFEGLLLGLVNDFSNIYMVPRILLSPNLLSITGKGHNG